MMLPLKSLSWKVYVWSVVNRQVEIDFTFLCAYCIVNDGILEHFLRPFTMQKGRGGLYVYKRLLEFKLRKDQLVEELYVCVTFYTK